LELCRRLRAEAPIAHLKLILLTPEAGAAELDGLERDPVCDDVVARSAARAVLVQHIQLALRLKETEERADRLAGHLLATNNQLEQALQQRDDSSLQLQEVLIFAMAKMAQLRGQETSSHLIRMQKYVRALAEQARALPALAPIIDDAYI